MNRNILLGVIVAVLIVAIAVISMNKGSEGRNPPNSAENAPPGSIHNLPVPPAVAAVKSLVAKQDNVSEGEVLVLSAFEKEWSDSCLGLGGPAESCLMAITPGWEVKVQSKGKETTYRTNEDGMVIREQK